MEYVADSESASLSAVWAGLGAAGVFEVQSVLETQDKSIWEFSPWREDPFHTVVSLAAFMVPMLALAIALRLLVWRAPGGPDRAQQTVRAAGAITLVIGVTLAFEWAAVITTRPTSPSGSWTSVQVGGMAVTSVLVVAVVAMLGRCRRPHGLTVRWQHDWLDDVVFVCSRSWILRRWAGPRTADWVRRHAMTVFVLLSLAAAVVITGAQAIGERLTDPLFIAWLLIAVTAGNLGFCVISNAVAGFIARPPRTRPRRVAETSLVAGCVGLLIAIAFHDALWSALGNGPLTSSALEALTLGAGMATCLAAAAVLLHFHHDDPA